MCGDIQVLYMFIQADTEILHIAPLPVIILKWNQVTRLPEGHPGNRIT